MEDTKNARKRSYQKSATKTNVNVEKEEEEEEEEEEEVSKTKKMKKSKTGGDVNDDQNVAPAKAKRMTKAEIKVTEIIHFF